MVALSVNGITVPVCSWKESDEEIGERTRAVSGRSLVSIRDRKFARKFTVRTEDTTLAEALRGLLTGDGFSWSFQLDHYSDQGLPVISAAGSTVGSSAPSPAFGSKRLAVPAGATVSWQLPSRYQTAWTVSCWVYESGATWNHYVLNSSLAKWKNGATTTDSVYVNVVTGGSTTQLQLSAPGGGAMYYDDVVCVPYQWHSTWPAMVYANMRPWKPFPFLEVDGDLMPAFGARWTCRGQYEGGPCVNRGAPGSRLREMDFTLYED